MIIAFSGPGNTGKSAVIERLSKDLDGSVSIYTETARQVLDTVGFGSMNQFQEKINAIEIERLENIKKDTAQTLLIDRTRMDSLVYNIYNMVALGDPINLNWKESGEDGYCSPTTLQKLQKAGIDIKKYLL